MGANREYILNHIPHIGRLMVDRPEQLLDHAEVIVVASAERGVQGAPQARAAGNIRDRSRGRVEHCRRQHQRSAEGYDGIAW